LARAVRAHDGVRLPRPDGQVNAVEDLLVVNGDSQVSNLQNGHLGISINVERDEYVIAVDLHSVHRDRPGGRRAGGLAGADVEARAVQPALEGAVVDVAL